MLNKRLLLVSTNCIIHHLFLQTYINGTLDDVNQVNKEIDKRYPDLKNIIDVVSIEQQAIDDVDRGLYDSLIKYYDSTSTISFFSNLDIIIKELKEW